MKILQTLTRLLKGYWFWMILIALLSFLIFKRINLLGIVDPLSDPGIAWLVHGGLAAPLTGILFYPLIVYPVGKYLFKIK